VVVSKSDLLAQLNTVFFTDKSLAEITINDLPISKTNRLPTSADIWNINGDQPGTAFGDDFVTTNRNPRIAGKWSQGLPVRGITVKDGTKGYWLLVPDPHTAGLYDGACEVGIAAGGLSNERLLVHTALPNRYEPGHLSYNGGTISFDFSAANGDCAMYIGFYSPGPKSQAKDTLIKEAVMWGQERISGQIVTKHIVIKNYTKVHDDIIALPDWLTFEHLTIFEQKLGYYGIHPSIIKIARFDSIDKRWINETLFLKVFAQNTTSVSDPNLKMGVFLENRGNTGKISLRNGSIEYGNYNTFTSTGDASARQIVDSIRIAGPLAVDPDDTDGSGLLAVYTVPDVVNMIVKVEQGGALLSYANLANTIGNRLLKVTSNASANRPLTLNIRFAPLEAVTLVAGQSFTQLEPGYNVLARAVASQIASINFALAETPRRIAVSATPKTDSFTDENVVLLPGIVAIISLVSTQATSASDITVTFDTIDLF
jgi:hypothetical protein